ncbi:hypothetical protein BD413DRAFT_605226 [Trametes elegans]|nr:hypothetical protein BD413DRAFT_605226 [Trametes elegans]
MSAPIHFYDIPGKTARTYAWSPNTWKIRFALNFKGIPYKTFWVEYPEIEAVCKQIGAPPTDKKPDGSPLYTLPAIYDPNTKAAVADSSAIIRYLEKTYPDTPTLLPPETDALHAAFEHAFSAVFVPHAGPLMLTATNGNLNPRSEAYFRAAREAVLGRLEALAPPGPKRDAHWRGLREAMRTIAGWLEADGRPKPFFLGERIAYADVTVAAWLLWLRILLGEDSPEWKELVTWDGARWARLAEMFKAYEAVDAGEVVGPL